ncbi:MAG: YlbF family regulator [Eubacteriales bacterium]|nr:YlbF family regulator [Eubacteriales bacterium]
METVNRNIHALLVSIQKCQIYKEFKKQEENLNKNPELAERVQRFRAENFRLQNEGEQGNLLEKAELLSRESEELRSFPEVNAYLDAELALCRMMQKICRTLTDGVEMNIPRI